MEEAVILFLQRVRFLSHFYLRIMTSSACFALCTFKFSAMNDSLLKAHLVARHIMGLERPT